LFDFSVNFSAIDNISSKINTINKKIDGVAKKAKDASKKLSITGKVKLNTRNAFQKLKSLEDKITGLAKKSIVIGGVGLAGVAGAVNSAKDYQLAFRDVKKAVDGTDEQLSALRTKMKNFKGASFEELSSITAEAGKMGFAADKVFEFTDSVVKGAKALDFDAELAVGQVGKILSMTNQMNDAVNAGRDIMNKVVNLENNLAGVKGGSVVDIWKRNADLYSQLNFDNKSMGAMSAFLDQTSVSAELGASGFKMMMNAFKKSEAKFGFVKKIKTGGLQGLKDVMQEISKMSDVDKIKKFGTGAMELINKLSNADNIKKLDFAYKISVNSAGAVDKEWAVFRATFDQRLKDMTKNIANTADSVGVLFLPVLTDISNIFGTLADKVGIFTKENPKLAKVIAYTTAILSGLAVVAGTVALAMFAISLPVLLWSAAIGVVVGALTALYIYWQDIVSIASELWNSISVPEWVTTGLKLLSESLNWIYDKVSLVLSKTTEWFSSFSFVKGAIKLINMLISPIQRVIDMISNLLSKLDIINNVKSKLSGIGESISGAFDSVVEFVSGDDNGHEKDKKNTLGLGETNINRNKSMQSVDIMVRAEPGTQAVAHHKENGNIKKLRTNRNGTEK